MKTQNNTVVADNSQSEVISFNFNGAELRAIQDENGEPWFVAKDVAEILEYSETRRMTARLEDDESSKIQANDSVGRRNKMTVISVSGLYRAIIGSKKPEAQAFKKWVTSVVLPSIRKTGSYLHTTGTESAEELYQRTMASLQAAIERQKAIAKEQAKLLQIQAKKIKYVNEVLLPDNLHTVDTIADRLGISANKLIKWLIAMGYIYKQGGIYYPSYKIRGKGYCDYHIIPYITSNGGTVTKERLKWTDAGRQFIIDKYNKNNMKIKK